MTKYISKSNLWKVTITLLVATLVVSLCIGVFAYADDGGSGETSAMGTPTEVVRLQVDGYTLSNGYYRADGGSGDYAFTQGMSIAQAQGLITGVVAADAEGNTRTLPLGADVTVTTEATSTNGSGDSFAVSFDVAVTADGADLYATIDVNFIAVRPYTLMLINPDWQSKVKFPLTPTTDLSQFMGPFSGAFAKRNTDGTNGGTVDQTALKINGTLAPSQTEIDSMIKDNRNTYSTFISVSYTETGYTIEPLKVAVESITYSNPTGVSRISGLPNQTARTDFNYGEATVTINYSSETATVNLAEIKQYFTPKYYENYGDTADKSELTTAINYVAFDYAIPGLNGDTLKGTTGQFYIYVSQRPQANPVVSDLHPTYKDGGAVITISGLLKDNNNPVDVSVTTKTGTGSGTATSDADGYTVTFTQGGTYEIVFSFTEGESGDYRWTTQNQGNPNPYTKNDYELVYTIEVDSAPVEITVDFPSEVTYGDNEPNPTVTAKYEGTTTQAYTTSVKGDASVEGDSAVLQLFYYGASYTDHTTAETASTKMPTEPGTYTVIIKTNKTNKFKAASTSASFEIVARKIKLSATFSSPMYERGKSYNATTLGDQLSIENIADTDKDNQKAVVKIEFADSGVTSVTHAGDYKVNLTITEAYKNKYAWEGNSQGDLTGESTFTIQKRPQQAYVSITNSSFVYGTEGANPGVSYKWNTETKYQYANIGDLKYYKQGDENDPSKAIGNTDFYKWDVGNYVAKYDVELGSGDKSTDYDLPELKATFTITQAEVDKVSVTNWSTDKDAPYDMGVYGTARNINIVNWPTDNTAPDDTSKILKSVITGVRPDGTTAITVTDGQTGSFALTQAGSYALTITLNSNYKWKGESNGNPVKLYAKIDKQTVGQTAISADTVYDGNDHTVNVKFVLGSGSAAWHTDSLKSSANNIVTIKNIVGSKYAAAKLANTVTANNDNGTFTVKYAGEYTATLELKDTNNYKWADGTKTEFTYTVQRAVFEGSYGSELIYQFDPELDGQTTPESNFVMSIVEADKEFVKLTFTLYDKDFNALDPQKITAAGDYYIMVTAIGAADGTGVGDDGIDTSFLYLNYELILDEKDTQDSERKVSVKFTISTMGLAEIELDPNTATIDGNKISFVYDAKDHNFSEFIKNKEQFGNAFGYLLITITGVDGNDPAVKNVKFNGDAVDEYVVTVTPAGDFKWNDETGLGEKDAVEYRIKITKRPITIDWSNATLEFTFNGSKIEVSGYKLDAPDADIDVNFIYTDKDNAVGDAVNAGTYTVTADSIKTSVSSANYVIDDSDNDKYHISDTLIINKYDVEAPFFVNGEALTFNGQEQVKTLTLQNNAAVKGFDWSNVIGHSIVGTWTFDNVLYGNHTESATLNIASATATTGTLTVKHAGEYTLTFTLKDTDNYQWKDASKTTLTLTVNRQEVKAPAMAAQRAIEYATNEDGSAKVQYPTFEVISGLSFTVGYGIEKNYDELVYDVSAITSSNYGYYFVKLNIDGSYLNYLWVENIDDTRISNSANNMSPMLNAGAPYWGYCVYTSDESSVYLHYAITKGILYVDYVADDYAFGANGYSVNGVACTIGEISGRTAILKMIASTVPGHATDIDIVRDSTTASVRFYSIANKNVGYADGAVDGNMVGSLVNGLPWAVGCYGAYVTLTFDEDSPYAPITCWCTFEITAREVELTWTGDEIVTYDGKTHTFSATIKTVICKDSETDVVNVPSVNVVWQNDSLPVNASSNSYVLTASIVEGSINATEFTIPTSANTKSLTINKRPITINVSGTYSSTYGNAIVSGHSQVTAVYGADSLKFIADGSETEDYKPFIQIKLYTSNGDAVGSVVTAAYPNAGSYFLVAELVSGYSENYELTNECQAAPYTINPRQITVTLNAANAVSVYGGNVALYQEEVVYNVVWNNKGDKTDGEWLVGADVKNVFTLTTTANNLSDVSTETNKYPVTLTVKDKNNYQITVNGAVVTDSAELGNWTITPATIENSKVSVLVNPPVTYKGQEGYSILVDLVTATVTLVNHSANQASVKWYYIKTADYVDGDENDLSKWTELTNAKQADVINESYRFMVTANNHNNKLVDGEQKIVINKREVKVTINLAIQFGEKSPTDVIADGKMYMATIEGLKTSMYGFSGFVDGENITNISGLTGAFEYETNYKQGNSAGSNYYIRFVNGQDENGNDTLTSANYKFVASDVDGVLTVNKLKLTVSIPNVTSTYGDGYSEKMFNGTTVTLPASTYTNLPLASGDLKDGEGRDIYDYINDATADFIGANVITLTTTAFTTVGTETRTDGVGDSYSITAAVKDAVNYAIDGEPKGVHEIISVDFTAADDIHGYGENGDVKYDEASHSAFVTVSGATVTTFVISKYDTPVVVRYYVASAQMTDAQLAELSENDWKSDMPAFIDKCEHIVYARIQAVNHNVKYIGRKVQITPATNVWTTEYKVGVTEWAYGLITDNDNKVTEGAAKYTRKDGVANANNVIVTLTDAEGNVLVTRTDGSVTEALKEAWSKGYFNYGAYELSVKLEGTDNYTELEETFTITVNKAILTITAENKTLTYGDPAPTYTYVVSGLTANIPNGTTETLWGVLGSGNESTIFNFFTSAYTQGSSVLENGYAITLGADSNSFDPDNYEIEYVYEGKSVTVNRRVVTIEIDNYSRTYNTDGSALNDELTFKIIGDVNFYEKDVASLLTSYTNNTQSIIRLDTEALKGSNGVKTNDVVKFANETVGWYPIYAVYRSQGGTGRSWSQNYEIKFAAVNRQEWPTNELADKPLEQPSEAIKQDGVIGIGCYTINQATASFHFEGIFHDENGEARATTVYTGLVNYYKVSIENGVTEPTYVYKDSKGNIVEKVIDAGEYTVTIGYESFNYIPSGNLTLPMNIAHARLDVSWQTADGIAATIQYGENIPGNFQESGDRFSGLTYVLTFTDGYWKALQQQNSEFFASCLDRKSDGDKWTTNGYTNTTDAGKSGLIITPVISVSDNFDVYYTGAALRVIPRDITVKVKGWNAGNDNATSEYEDNRDPLTIKGWALSEWFEVVDESNPFVTVSGKKHTLADLALSLAISSGEDYNASVTAKKVTVTKGINDVSKNYNVKFVVVIDEEGNTSDYIQGDCQPTYLITKRKVTLTVKDKEVIYGGEVNEILKQGMSQGSITPDTFAAYFEFDNRMFANGGYNAAGSGSNKYVFDFVYSPYGNHVGDDIALNLKWNVEGGSVIVFNNYEIENIVPGKLIVKQRVISAKAGETTYTEAIENGHPVYNNGVYGAERIAPITFEGEGYNDVYRPEYALQYRQGQGGWTTTAPNKAGSYEVKVILDANANGKYDYAFNSVGAFESVPQAYKVNKKSLDNIRWTKQSIRTDSESVDMTNSIVGYVASIMTFGPNDFQKSVGYTYTSIGMGSKDDSIDKYWFGTVGSEQVGLNITSYNVGTYRITITLTDEAKANYKWDANESPSVTLTFTVSANAVVINGLAIKGWTYGNYDVKKNGATFTVIGGEVSGVQITYALITAEDLANKDSFDDISLWYTTLSYSASVPVNAGSYVVRTFYPAYGDVGSAEAFTEFTVSKAAMPRPAWSQETDYTFNGQQQSLELTLVNPLAVRVLSYNCASYVSTSTGFTLYATNAGNYKVEFSLVDNVNYEWENDESRYIEWTISKDESGNVITWKNSVGEKVVYGKAFMPSASSTYNGNISYYYALKDGISVPTDGWIEFNPNNGLSRINVDQYWVKAVDNGNDNNYNKCEKTIWFEVVKATLTITPNGYMTYGDSFENGLFTWRNNVAGLVNNDTYSVIDVSGIKYKVQDLEDGKYVWKSTPYQLVFETDAETDEIVGMAAQNYIIKSGVGEFIVNKRSITISIGNATSQYGRDIDLSAVTIVDDDKKLVEGDDLGLTLSTTAEAENGRIKPIGGYIITATTTNNNYDVTINPGTYTITERRIKIDIVATDGTYLDKPAVVEIKNVIDDETGDVITTFVTSEDLTLTITYKGIVNEDAEHPYNSTVMPTKAGTYTATVRGSNNNNFIIVGEPFTSFVINKKAVDGSLITIANQTYTKEALTPVLKDDEFIALYGDNIYEEVARDEEFINADTYTVTLIIKDFANYKWQSVEVAERNYTFTVDKAQNSLIGDIVILGWAYGEYSVDNNLPTATVKFGQNEVTFLYSNAVDGIYTSGAPAMSDVGEYWVKVTVPADDNYNVFTSDPVKFAITKRALVKPTLAIITEGEGKNDTYTGEQLLATVVGYDMALMNLYYDDINVSGGQIIARATNAGVYTIKLSIANTHNYCWQGTDDEEIALVWTVARKAIAKPTENTDRFIVNGRVLTYIPEGFDEEIMTISGNETAYGGEFPVTIGLKDKANYMWLEGGDDDYTLTWNVVGINTVFVIVSSVIGGASGIALIALGVQLIRDHRRRRFIDLAIDARSKAEAMKAPKKGNEDETDKGGND